MYVPIKIHWCYKLNCVLLKFMCWSPEPNVTVLGNGAFTCKVKWGHKGRTLFHRISTFIEETPESLLLFFLSLPVHSPKKCMWTHSKATSQEDSPHQIMNPTQFSRLQKCGKSNSCHLSHTVCGILLLQPERTETTRKAQRSSKHIPFTTKKVIFKKPW